MILLSAGSKVNNRAQIREHVRTVQELETVYFTQCSSLLGIMSDCWLWPLSYWVLHEILQMVTLGPFITRLHFWIKD